MFRVRTFGQSAIEAGAFRLTPASVRAFALVLYLAAERGRRVPRAVVLSMIFGDQAEPNASHSLRQLLYKLRQSGVMLESKGDEVALVGDAVQLDYVDFLAADRLGAEQLELIKGGFLPDFAPSLTEAYSEWFDGFRARTTLELRRALVRDLARARSVGDWRTGEQAARACLALDSLNEEATLGLAEALAAAGSKTEAVELLDNYLAEIGPGDRDLRLPATVLRRRISERVALPYRAQPELPFVGREEEMLLLGERFQRARAGDSQCVVLHGEAGIGKSRLAAEFATVAALDGARVVRVAAQPHDVHRPMGVFVDLVPLLLELPGALGCSPESMAALKRLTTHGATREVDDRRDAESIFLRITRAISDLIEAIAAESPLVVTVEDLHWGDDLSNRLVGDLACHSRPSRILLLITTRIPQEFGGRSLHADRLTSLPLGGLREAAADTLIALAVRGAMDTEDSQLRGWMASIARGNPLFIGAVTSHYAATGQRFAVPPTVSELLTKRLESIDRASFALMQLCVVLGKYCTLERIQAAAGVPLLDLVKNLQTVSDARLLVPGDSSVSVAHAIVADAVLALSSPPVLRVLHQRVAELLESDVGTLESAACLWDTAEHWAAAQNNVRALETFRRCAKHAISLGRPSAASQVFQRILQLPLTTPDRVATAISLSQSADSANEFALALSASADARANGHHRAHDNAELSELRAMLHLARPFDGLRSRLFECITCTEAGEAHRIGAATLALMAAHNESDRELAHATMALLRGLIEFDPKDVAQTHFLLIHDVAFGELAAAQVLAERLVDLSRSLSPAAAARIQLNASRAMWIAGNGSLAIATLEDAYLNCVSADVVRFGVMAAARIASYSRDLALPIEHIRAKETQAVELERQFPLAFDVSDYGTWRAQLGYNTGDVVEARRCLARTTQAEGVDRSGHMERWVHALELGIGQLSGRPISTESARTLIDRAKRSIRHEVADFEIAVALSGLIAAGMDDEARRQLQSYISTDRSILSPLMFELRECAHRLQVDGRARTVSSAQTPAGGISAI